MLSSFHAVATQLNHSNAKMLLLHTLMENAGRNPVSPPQAFRGRWGSDWRLLVCCIDSRVFLQQVPNLTLPTEEEWDLARDIVLILRPVMKATTMFQVEKRPTAAMVYPFLFYLQQYYDEIDERTPSLSCHLSPI